MNLRICRLLSSFCLLVYIAGGNAAVCFAEPQPSGRDNSGRQLAVVVPGLPHPAQAASTPMAGTKVASSAGWRNQKRAEADHAKTVSGMPGKLSPELKQALDTSTVVAQGFSKIAIRRASDVAGWVATMWRQFNEVPVFSPATEFSPPAPPTSSMRPLAEPTSREKTLYYTPERRIKTVVGQ